MSYAEPAIALRALTAPGSIVVVAVEDRGIVVGFVQPQTDGVVHAHVSNILVEASHRQCRIGRQLLEHAFARSGAQYLIAGAIRFILEGVETELVAGDFCSVPQGTRFSYSNAATTPAKLVLVHTPSFNLTQEVFVESPT